MYNKKCLSTFLFCVALLSLITLILPFINVNYFGDVSVVLKIVFYIMIVLFAISVVLIIAIGIFNLFKNDFTLVPVQQLLSYIAIGSLLITIVVFSPVTNANLTLGFSILFFESFVLSCFNEVLRLIRKLPRTFKAVSSAIKLKKEQKQKILDEKLKLEQESAILNEKLKTENAENIEPEEDIDEVKIIPPTDYDEMV